MMHMNPPDYDLLGIGFGPSNLALAIALDGANRADPETCRFHFIERQPRFTWHGGMLLPGSDMQISFLKDLVSLRDPTSPLTFVNYLHKQGRLEDFANCKTFYPSRVEFNDYLRWVADSFSARCSYGETVVAVEPVRAGDTVTALRVVTQSESGRESVRQTRGLAVAVGGSPHVPDLFKPLGADPRLLHSSRYLDRIDACGLERPGARVAVIGGGQSAAEITVDLQSRFPEASIDLIFRGHALKPSDSSPFVNEIFHPSYTDFMYDLSEPKRDAIVRTFRNTNYAVVDPDLLEALHKILYQQKVEGRSQVSLIPRNEIRTVTAVSEGIAIGSDDPFAERARNGVYDVVVLATGYERNLLHPFLEPVAGYIEDLSVDRNYRLAMRSGFQPQIYLQGYSEISHGLSDTLLSVLAMRSQEIAEAIFAVSGTRDAVMPSSMRA